MLVQENSDQDARLYQERETCLATLGYDRLLMVAKF